MMIFTKKRKKTRIKEMIKILDFSTRRSKVKTIMIEENSEDGEEELEETEEETIEAEEVIMNSVMQRHSGRFLMTLSSIMRHRTTEGQKVQALNILKMLAREEETEECQEAEAIIRMMELNSQGTYQRYSPTMIPSQTSSTQAKVLLLRHPPRTGLLASLIVK